MVGTMLGRIVLLILCLYRKTRLSRNYYPTSTPLVPLYYLIITVRRVSVGITTPLLPHYYPSITCKTRLSRNYYPIVTPLLPLYYLLITVACRKTLFYCLQAQLRVVIIEERFPWFSSFP